MIINWLHRKQKAEKVIVFFNGWAFTDAIVAHLIADDDTDVLTVNDYRDISTPLPNLNQYAERNLIAWSFGVGSYLLWQQQYANYFTRKIAINGTPQTIDRKLGIANKVVQHTIDTLSAESHQTFLQRCNNNTLKSEVTDIEPKKAELIEISRRDYSSASKDKWDMAWISHNDPIFASKNQLRAWRNNQINMIEAPHAPFSYWSKWQDILA